MTKLIQQPAAQSGTLKIGGDLPVHRLGFGAMRLTARESGVNPQTPPNVLRFFGALSIWAST